MELRQLVAERRGPILERWFEAVMATYPAGGRQFLSRRGDPFGNPVGTTTRRALGGILDALVAADPAAGVAGPLDEILRVRAVQDFSAAQAVGFTLALKRVVREDCAAAGIGGLSAADWAQWDDRIDALALAAFDTYMKFREQTFRLRSAEWKNRMFRLLQRAKLVCGVDLDDDPERDPDGEEPTPRGGS